jgi:hypothetical protein
MAQDVPEALDDTSWIAVKDGTVEAIVKVLDLSDPKPATWVQGMEVVGGYHLVARFRPDEFRSRWQPDVGDVPRIADEWSVNPWRIGPRTRLVGQGFVALTPWGRRQGVVFNGLG